MLEDVTHPRTVAADLPGGWGADLFMLSPHQPQRGESIPAQITVQFSPGTLAGSDREDVFEALEDMEDGKAEYVVLSKREGNVEEIPALDHQAMWSVGPYSVMCRTIVLAFPQRTGMMATRATVMLTAQESFFEMREETFKAYLQQLASSQTAVSL